MISLLSTRTELLYQLEDLGDSLQFLKYVPDQNMRLKNVDGRKTDTNTRKTNTGTLEC